MLTRNVLAVVVAGLALPAATLTAQENRLSISLHGGAQAAADELAGRSSSKFDRGLALGAGAALALHPNVALRADVMWARNEATGPVLGATEFDRLFFGADLQLRYPFDNGLMPYVFAGAGGVRITENDSEAESVNSPAARLGGGLSFAVPGLPVQLFTQATAWNYSFYGWPGLSSYQWDTAYTVGISYDLNW